MTIKSRPAFLIMGLTLVAGGVDALAYFRLGHVFVAEANMTGMRSPPRWLPWSPMIWSQWSHLGRRHCQAPLKMRTLTAWP